MMAISFSKSSLFILPPDVGAVYRSARLKSTLYANRAIRKVQIKTGSLRNDRSDLAGFSTRQVGQVKIIEGCCEGTYREQGGDFSTRRLDMSPFFQQREFTYSNHFRYALRPHRDFTIGKLC